MRAVHHQLQSLTCQRPEEIAVNATIAFASCIAMFQGLVNAMPYIQSPERIANFVLVSLPVVVGLLNRYADDLALCEQLLALFCSYAEKVKNIKLDGNQMSIFLRGTSDVLQLYASYHCSARVVHAVKRSEELDKEEEKAYEDILCALRLIKNLLGRSKGDPSQIAEVSFFGIQQLQQLMTQGLLTYPVLCTEYFSVVCTMVDRHPEKIPTLPNDLFQGLLHSLQMGVVHHDTQIAKRCLASLERLYKEHLQTGSLQRHLQIFSDLFRSGIRAVVETLYQPILWDRLEETSAVVLALIALDRDGFLAISEQVASRSKFDCPARFRCASQKLIQPRLIDNVLASGYEVSYRRIETSTEKVLRNNTLDSQHKSVNILNSQARENQRLFQDSVKVFAADVQSFLTLK
jgi:hypothetical protein